VFGMGTGVAPPATPPGTLTAIDTAVEHGDSRAQPDVVPQSRTSRNNRGQAARAISTGQLNALRRLHLRPINLVIYEGPSEGLRPGRSHLQAGFALRCLQRLSLPDIATERCSWRNSSHTRGPSTPVLSY
jgi:hypothetical protein